MLITAEMKIKVEWEAFFPIIYSLNLNFITPHEAHIIRIVDNEKIRYAQ